LASIGKTLKATEQRWERWKAAADLAGLPLNGWLTRACDRSYELELALHRQELREQADQTRT
jgi:hypothetical protein